MITFAILMYVVVGVGAFGAGVWFGHTIMSGIKSTVSSLASKVDGVAGSLSSAHAKLDHVMAATSPTAGLAKTAPAKA